MSHDAPLPGYTIRRPLPPSALVPAIGVGVAIGLAAFYVTKLLLERQPLLTPEERERRARALERRTGKRVSTMGGEMVGSAADLDADESLDELPERYEKRIARRVKRLVQHRLEEEREAEEARAAEREAKREARREARLAAARERQGGDEQAGAGRDDAWDRRKA